MAIQRNHCRQLRPPYCIAVFLFIGILPASALLGDEPSNAQTIEFTTDVMPALSKAGCNLGICHGNLNGKGGLKLSLRGQDPEFDFQALVGAARGRRINIAAPGKSLFLMKATGDVPHGGGVRIQRDSPRYHLLTRWLRTGADGPNESAAKLTRLDVAPASAIVADPQSSVPITVHATFSDGTKRDVTDTACYELSNLSADVDPHGVVSRKKFGETTLIVRYLERQVPVPIAFIPSRRDFTWSEAEPFNAIDRHVFEKLQRLRMNPSAICTDHVFVRRAHLDAIGRLPTAEEAKRFVTDPSENKRNELIDKLLAREEFADYWAMKWADVLRVEEKVLDTAGVEVFHDWIRENLREARPLDEIVRDLVTGSGKTFETPEANYYRANRDPLVRGETTARLFLGTRLQCAKCHNHPFDRWTQDDYYRWASLFSQIKYEVGENKRNDKLDKNEFAGDQEVLFAEVDEIKNPTTGEIALPKFLGGDVLAEDVLEHRLEKLAEWLTSPENDLFVKSQTNFIWYQLMGLGIVDPIDDFRLTNPPSNPALLDELADHFRRSGFDVRSLVAEIMKSRTYQLSSVPNETNQFDQTSFSHAIIRRLPAEVILDMQSDVLQAPASFLGYQTGIRAVQIPGAQSKQMRRKGPMDGDRFLKTFGKPERILACDCERSNETTLKQAFMLIGQGLNERIVSPSNRVGQLARSTLSDEEVIDELYWSALSRPPSDSERKAALTLINGPRDDRVGSLGELVLAVARNPSNNDRLTALQDITWALLNAKEFLFRR